MASQSTNDAKRAEMHRVVDAAFVRGWTVAQLAQLMSVTPATVRRWHNSDSMGTNAQRAKLAALKTPKEERPRLLEIAAQCRTNALAETLAEASCAAAGALQVAGNHRAKAARLSAYADFLETIGL